MPAFGNLTSITVIKCLGDLATVTSIEVVFSATSTPTYILEYSTTGNVGSWVSAGSPSGSSTSGSYYTLNYNSLPGSSTLYWRFSAQCNNSGTATVAVSDFRAFNGSAEFLEGATLQPVAGTTPRLEMGLSKDGGVSIAGSRLSAVLGLLQPVSVGSVSDLFGSSWTRDDLNSSSFALVVRRSLLGDEDTSLPRYLDTLALDVYYTPEGASLVALERQFSTQKILIGKESTAGTAATPSIRIMGTDCNFSPKGDWKKWSPTGDKTDSLQMLIREWSEGQFNGIPTYNELGYFLNNSLNLDAPSTITAGAYAHRWYFNARQANTVSTYTLQYGDPEDATRAHQVTYAFGDSFDLNFDRTKAELKVNMMGQAITDGITMASGAAQVWGLAQTGTPTGGTFVLAYKGARTTALAYNVTQSALQTALQALSTVGSGNMVVTGSAFPYTITAAGALLGQNLPNIEVAINSLTGGTTPAVVPTVTTSGGYTETALQPILPGQLAIYVGSTYASLSSSKLTRAFVSNVSFKALRAPVWVLDPLQSSFAATIEPEATIEITVMVEADSNGMAFLTNARSGTQMYVRLLATGNQIAATGQNFTFQLDACAKISSLPPFSDKDGVYAVEYKFTVDHDTTQGFSTFIQLINDVASY